MDQCDYRVGGEPVFVKKTRPDRTEYWVRYVAGGERCPSRAQVRYPDGRKRCTKHLGTDDCGDVQP